MPCGASKLEKENLKPPTHKTDYMGILSFLGFGKGKIKAALQQDAVIIDVRTVNEYDGGKIPGSINIPVDRIAGNIDRIKAMNKPIVCCCASGMRSSMAVSQLKAKGIKNVYNGGNWTKVMKILQQL
jgi:phage shock protein E